MRVIYESPELTLCQGAAVEYDHPLPDLVLTNPYGYLPPHFVEQGIPMILHQWDHHKDLLAEWVGCQPADLHIIARWNAGRETFWALNVPERTWLDFTSFHPEDAGWWPYAMVESLLRFYGKPGILVWDGFCGRGTGAKAALALGMRWIGCDKRMEALTEALLYLGVTANVS